TSRPVGSPRCPRVGPGTGGWATGGAVRPRPPGEHDPPFGVLDLSPDRLTGPEAAPDPDYPAGHVVHGDDGRDVSVGRVVVQLNRVGPLVPDGRHPEHRGLVLRGRSGEWGGGEDYDSDDDG